MLCECAVVLESELAAQAGNGAGKLAQGDEFTLVDFYAAALCRWAALYPLDQPGTDGRWEKHPSIRAWLYELQALPAIARACARETIEAPFFVNPRPASVDPRCIVG